jgi:hypothetical protein
MDDDDGDIEECIILKAPSCYYTRDAVVTWARRTSGREPRPVRCSASACVHSWIPP